MDEIEAVRDLSQMVDGTGGQEAVEGAAVHCKDDEHRCSGGGAPIVEIGGKREVLDDTAGIGEAIENQGNECDSSGLNGTELCIPSIDRMKMRRQH